MTGKESSRKPDDYVNKRCTYIDRCKVKLANLNGQNKTFDIVQRPTTYGDMHRRHCILKKTELTDWKQTLKIPYTEILRNKCHLQTVKFEKQFKCKDARRKPAVQMRALVFKMNLFWECTQAEHT
jgi:hypothetical protein